MTRRWCWTFLLAVLLGGCADAGLKREVADLRARVAQLEAERGGGALDVRVSKLEKFLAPYIDQPATPPEPDPAVTYAIPIDGDPVVGPADAPLTMVFAFDYACPYCFRERDTLAELRQAYGANLRIVYKFFIVHPKTATLPTHAACAALQQGKFVEMDAALWKMFEGGGYSREGILAAADALHLDHDRFVADFDGEACAALAQADYDLLSHLGMNGTPGTFVNGRFIGGAQPLDVFKKLADEELAKANERIAAGTKGADYYRKYVVEGGKKDR